MEYILVLLIVALLNGAIAYIDGLMEGIIPLTLYAEQYMSTLAGVDLFQSLFDIVFGFGVSLIVLKFLKKGFETYVLWSDGDADEEPIAILTNFFKAMAVAICFPTMYDWLATIVEEMSNKMLEAIGLATAYDWAGWVSGISSMGLVTAMQDPDYQLFTDSVYQELLLALSDQKDKDEKRIDDILDELNLTIYKERHPMSLSGGQKQRTAIGVAALRDAEVLIFDEPTSGLDYKNMESVAGILSALSKRGKAILVISHDNELLMKICSRVIRVTERTSS